MTSLDRLSDPFVVAATDAVCVWCPGVTRADGAVVVPLIADLNDGVSWRTVDVPGLLGAADPALRVRATLVRQDQPTTTVPLLGDYGGGEDSAVAVLRSREPVDTSAVWDLVVDLPALRVMVTERLGSPTGGPSA